MPDHGLEECMEDIVDATLEDTIRKFGSQDALAIAYLMRSLLGAFKDKVNSPKAFLDQMRTTIDNQGGVDALLNTCDGIITCHSPHGPARKMRLKHT